MVLAWLLIVGCSRSNEDQFRLAIKNVHAGHSISIDLHEIPMVDDSLLSKLCGIKALAKPNRDKTRVIDEGPASVTVITEPGIAELTDAQHVLSPSLFPMRVTDSGCKELAKIISLERLSLDTTMITDRVLSNLKSPPSLTQLRTCQRKISEGGAKEFQHDTPDVGLNQ